MKNSTWLNIWAVVTFFLGIVEIIAVGSGFAFVMSAMFTTGAAVCKAIEKTAA